MRRVRHQKRVRSGTIAPSSLMCRHAAVVQVAATRLTCEIDVTGKDVLPLLQGLDRWVVEHVIQNNLFENMTREDVAKQYHPCLQFSEKYNALRTRMHCSSGLCKR